MALLSPGVEVIERDFSVSPTLTGSNFGVFCGRFSTGPCDVPVMIAGKNDYISIFGKPTNTNYDDWFQPFNYLSYAGGIYVTRLIDRNGQTNTTDTGLTVATDAVIDDSSIELSGVAGIFQNCFISIGNDNTVYQVEEIVGNLVSIIPSLTVDQPENAKIYLCTPSYNSGAEVEKLSGTTPADIKPYLRTIANYAEHEQMIDSITFSSMSNIKLRFSGRYPGANSNNTKVAIANPSDFTSGTAEAFPGISLNSLMAYYPATGEIAVLVYDEVSQLVVETFLVSLTPGAKDANNKSYYIEDVINRQSNYIYVKNNESVSEIPASKIGSNAISLIGGNDGNPGKDEYVNTLNYVYGDLEAIDIDTVIANSLAPIETAAFAKFRGDCIAFLGAQYSDVVGFKADLAVNNLLTYRATGELNIDNKYSAFIANYAYQYDQYNDKYRWIGCQSHGAGLRAQTTNQRAPWYASFGLNQGQLVNVIKLAFNPNVSQRDLLYKNNMNPCVSFPNLGTVLWGQKTLTAKPSVFDRIQTRCLYNYLERTIRKASKYVIGEQNDSITRNLFVSMCKPVLEYAHTGRGISDYIIVCDDTNNPPASVQQGMFTADFYIKSTMAVEFITLRFTAVGNAISFSEVVG